MSKASDTDIRFGCEDALSVTAGIKNVTEFQPELLFRHRLPLCCSRLPSRVG